MGSESAVASSLASFKTASRTRELRAATSASWSISSRTRCQCGRSSRSLPIAAMYSHASPIVLSVPPSFVGIGEVSFLVRYAGLNMARKTQSIRHPLFLFAPSSFELHSHTAGAVLHLEPIGRAAELEPKGGGKVARIRKTDRKGDTLGAINLGQRGYRRVGHSHLQGARKRQADHDDGAREHADRDQSAFAVASHNKRAHPLGAPPTKGESTRPPGWAQGARQTPANWRRVLTSLNLVVRCRSRACARNQHAAGAAHKHRTSLDQGGSGCVPFFAASWKQRQAGGVVLRSLS